MPKMVKTSDYKTVLNSLTMSVLVIGCEFGPCVRNFTLPNPQLSGALAWNVVPEISDHLTPIKTLDLKVEGNSW